jgi:hypothetical protein
LYYQYNIPNGVAGDGGPQQIGAMLSGQLGPSTSLLSLCCRSTGGKLGMKWIALTIGICCSLLLWGQAYKETLDAPISFNNIRVTDNRNKNTAYAATITVSNNVATLTEKGALAAQVGDTVTLTTNGGSQNPPDPGLLGTFTLLTANNVAGVFTYKR